MNTKIRKYFVIILLILNSMSQFCFAQDSLTDQQVIDLFKGLRVADVCDGMDMVGLRDQGIMSPEIEALWRDIENLSHIVCGIAVTARYVPTNKIVKNPMNRDEFQKWEGNWYNHYSSEPFVEHIKKGSIIVLDVQGDGDVGSVGSFNSLYWKSKGAVGIVSNGGIRDTDEIIKQKIPVYLNMMQRGRGIRPGRNEIESTMKPVTIGGVLVNPGDVIIADGDGVIVVPREYAKEVAQNAHEILSKDKKGRKNLYKELNMPLDKTVQ